MVGPPALKSADPGYASVVVMEDPQTGLAKMVQL
jgi:hypothetical protein